MSAVKTTEHPSALMRGGDGEPAPVLTGCEIVLEGLRQEGVEVIFGHPGGAIMPFYDALVQVEHINFVLARHEQGAVHMAEGYARACGKVGTVAVTSGPGATNIVTGLADAIMDSVPIVAFTGQVPTPLIGSDAFQEADVTGITRSVTKHNYLVKDVRELAEVVKEAYYVARSGRPGPVLIDLPKDVTVATAPFEWPETVEMRSYRPTVDGHPKQIKKAAELIAKAERPVLYVGGGVIISEAHPELHELAERTHIPVVTTLMALGAFPAAHPLCIGLPGMHGSVCANWAFTESDLIVSVGARFDDRVTGKIARFAPNADIIHIDVDPAAISKNVVVDVPIVGDAKRILAQLLEVVEPRKRTAWNEQIDVLKRKYPFTYKRSDDKILSENVIDQLNEVCGDDAIITTEVGQHQMWAAQFYKFNKPRTFITSGGLGTMGFGFPAAIGAQYAYPDRIVVDIAGDGSIQMTIQELSAAVQYNLPVIVAILDNAYLGMVRQWQELFFGKRYSGVDLECSPNFAKLAEAYGALGIEVWKPEEVRPAIEQAVRARRPTLLHFHVAKEDNVFPMVPPGAGIDEMVIGPSGERPEEFLNRP
jgi:acetolactate synthase-1/2/3 large subunit